ncbi:MAG: hypothetical protein A4S09_16940 [Proteobacteria bacterium SG_bin7]|nr:MAG: hypothetical protein A4S09_16940 [Proteobacteria bacterium SG_bin7]
MAGPSVAGRKVSSTNSSDTQTCDTIDFIFECLWKDKDFLQQKYVIEGLSIAQIAAQILSSREAVRTGLIAYGIKRKSREYQETELHKFHMDTEDPTECWSPILANSELFNR